MIDCVEGEFFLTDLGSTNGTFIDGAYTHRRCSDRGVAAPAVPAPPVAAAGNRRGAVLCPHQR